MNVLDRRESAVTPSGALEVGRASIEAEPGSVRQDRELWRWFVLAGLAILALEWWIYSRRAWI